MAWKWVSMLAMWHLTYYLKISRAHHCKILKKPPGIIILLKRQQRTDEGELTASSSDWLNDFWPIYFEVHCNLEVIRVHWCNVWSSSHYKQLTSGFFDPPWRKLMMMPRRWRRRWRRSTYADISYKKWGKMLTSFLFESNHFNIPKVQLLCTTDSPS